MELAPPAEPPGNYGGRQGCSICCRVGVCGACTSVLTFWGPVSMYACLSKRTAWVYVPGVCVCVWVTVSGAVHVSVGLCMSLFVCLCYAAKSSLASNDKQEFSRRLVKRGLVKIVI